MSDERVRAALRSEARLVVIEAPAGCGKTHQAADYAREIVLSGRFRRPMILTHTHAACSVFAERTEGAGEIRTLDSVIGEIGGVYHAGLGLPADVAAWVREDSGKRYAILARKVACLLARNPMIAAAVARRHGIVICDEHQDSTADQHAVIMALHAQGALVRVFADPMQAIFKESHFLGAADAWQTLRNGADAAEELDQPHRWVSGCPKLGAWTLHARKVLMAGELLDLRSGLPDSVIVLRSDNTAQRHQEFAPSQDARRRVDEFLRTSPSLLLLSAHNRTARGFRSLLYRQLPLWEGHVRNALDGLVLAVRGRPGDAEALGAAIVDFLGIVATGFSPSAYGNRLQEEIRTRCQKPARGSPVFVQELARILIETPNHQGMARMLRQMNVRRKAREAFENVHLDHHQEFWDAVRLEEFEVLDTGLAELTRRRSHMRPKPPARAISNVHKAKGLECGKVIVMPCDSGGFPATDLGRRLLYVALSRAKERLMLVVPLANPSPILAV